MVAALLVEMHLGLAEPEIPDAVRVVQVKRVELEDSELNAFALELHDLHHNRLLQLLHVLPVEALSTTGGHGEAFEDRSTLELVGCDGRLEEVLHVQVRVMQQDGVRVGESVRRLDGCNEEF